MERSKAAQINPIATASTQIRARMSSHYIHVKGPSSSSTTTARFWLSLWHFLNYFIKLWSKEITEPCPLPKWFPALDCKVTNYSSSNLINRTLLTPLTLAARVGRKWLQPDTKILIQVGKNASLIGYSQDFLKVPLEADRKSVV